MAFPPKKPGPKGPHTPIKEYPGDAAPGSAPAGPLKGSAPAAPAATKSTNAAGPQAAAGEPKLSPEAEAARAAQGAVKITTATGPAVAPPPDPRASYQVGEAEDNTPIFSFTALASAAQQKGNPSALVQPAANSDLQGTAPVNETMPPSAADGPDPLAQDQSAAPAAKKAAPAEKGKKKPAVKKPPFGKKV